MAKRLRPYTPEQTRLRRLLRRGYFPTELPPPFSTRSFGQVAVDLAAQWDPVAMRKFWSAPEHYSIPRYGHIRRQISIVNPVNQFHVAQLISDNWTAIRARLQRSQITEFHPEIILQGETRAVSGVNFDGVSRRRAEILARYGRYVKTDIVRFYPSIYTHSIAWACLGKDWVKQNFSSQAFKDSFANHLDKAVAAGQAGQTIGIPIGPDTSRIISELVASELEILARRQIPDLDARAVRYVDDMLIGLNETETPDAVLSKLSSALYEYELELNGEKTLVQGMGVPHAPEWIHFVRSFSISAHVGRQREDLDSFFEQALHLSDANRQENVLLFATKRAASFPVANENRNHLIRWLLYCARRSSSCLSFVAEHVSSWHHQGIALPANEISDYIHEQISLRAEAGHTAEVSWLIFWARELGLELQSSALLRVTQLRSGTNALLVFDMIQRGWIRGSIDESHWRSFATTEGLKSPMWLAAYEVTKKGWWQRPKGSGYITSHAFFSDLWNRDIEFYLPNLRARAQTTPQFSLGVQTTTAATGYP